MSNTVYNCTPYIVELWNSEKTQVLKTYKPNADRDWLIHMKFKAKNMKTTIGDGIPVNIGQEHIGHTCQELVIRSREKEGILIVTPKIARELIGHRTDLGFTVIVPSSNPEKIVDTKTDNTIAVTEFDMVKFDPKHVNKSEVFFSEKQLERLKQAKNIPKPKTHTKVPRIVHEIWIGEHTISNERQEYMDTWKNACEKEGWKYELWGNDRLTPDYFPLTWDRIVEIQEYMKKTGKNRYAQIADFMRYEILYHHGGLYVDTTMRLVQSLSTIEKYAGNSTLWISGESDIIYISIGFMGSIPHHPAHHLAIATISEIDITNNRLNVTSGPWYWKMWVELFYDNFVCNFPTIKIYPKSPTFEYIIDGSLPDILNAFTFRKWTMGASWL